MKGYYRVMLGKQSVYARECFEAGFIGADIGVQEGLTGRLAEDWRAFNREFIPVFLKSHPDKSKIGAGLACGFLWTVAKGIQQGDMVLSPNGANGYRIGEVVGDHAYHPGPMLPHRRPVRWLPQVIGKGDLSDALRKAMGSAGTVCNVSQYNDEIERLVGGHPLIATDESVEDPYVFALEKHLEDFLVANWSHTNLGKEYDVYEEDGERVGQQYPTDTGPIDILAIRKDRKELLVVELKRGRASDTVVGQVLRYMGYVVQELAEEGQTVRGVIIATDDAPGLRRSLAVARNIAFYKYEVSFKLLKA